MRILGFSNGGWSAVFLARKMDECDFFREQTVDLLATIDPKPYGALFTGGVSANVRYFWNHYRTQGADADLPFGIGTPSGQWVSSGAAFSEQVNINPAGSPMQSATNKRLTGAYRPGESYTIGHSMAVNVEYDTIISLLRIGVEEL